MLCLLLTSNFPTEWLKQGEGIVQCMMERIREKELEDIMNMTDEEAKRDGSHIVRENSSRLPPPPKKELLPRPSWNEYENTHEPDYAGSFFSDH